MGALNGKRIALLIGPNFEDSEAIYPYYRLQEEGAAVEVLSTAPAGTVIKGKHGVPLTVARSVTAAAASEYDGLVIPGGQGPDAIRTNPEVIRFTKEFFTQNKPVAAICHGPQVLINADVLRGVKATGYASIAQDVKNAGALYEDKETVVDTAHRLVTARQPGDMPHWLPAVIEMMQSVPSVR